MGVSKKQQKMIETLDRSVQMCREFMNDWLLFNQILSAYPSPGVNKAQLESQFLKIKSKLAREHQVLREALGNDYKFDANMMNIVSGATNLESIYGQSEVAVKKLQTEWHRAFISINETLGVLEDKKARAEAGEKVMIGAGPENIATGKPFPWKTLLIVVGVVVVLGVMLVLFKDTYEDMLGIELPW